MDIPSYMVNQGDVITWKAVNGSVPDYIDTLTDGLPKRPVPSWLQLEVSSLKGEMTAMPHPSEIDTGIDARLIVEFYSK